MSAASRIIVRLLSTVLDYAESPLWANHAIK